METPVLLNQIHKRYRPGLLRRDVPALSGLDIAVRSGEIYALIGPNGAGKTTTFRILLGLMRPDSGTGALFGLPLGDIEARRRLGFLPEAPCYYPFLTVAELLTLAARLSGVGEPRAAVERTLEMFRLGPLRARTLRRLSKGQLQRIGLAQASLHDPDLLILDEPMSGLDPLGRAEVKEWIRSLREDGRTVLLASHVLADVEALADRVGVLEGGRIIAEGSAEDLLEGTDTEVEIEFEYAADPANILEGHPGTLESRAGLWAISLAGPTEVEVGSILSRVLSRGGIVRSVSRRRQSLEEYYVRSIHEARAGGAGA